MQSNSLGSSASRSRSTSLLVALILLTGCSRSPSSSPSTDPRLRVGDPRLDSVLLEHIGEFDEPIQVTSPPGDRRLFVVERKGTIRIWEGGKLLSDPFLTITSQVSVDQENGLLSIAFPPDYSVSGLTYVSYTDLMGNNRFVEYKVSSSNPNRLDTNSQRTILLVHQNSPVHNGGLMEFDNSGMLLIAVGDGGPDTPAQDLTNLLGKFLRIDPTKPANGLPYSVPEDNPFVSTAGVRPEIWGYGLRNPWRWSLDPETEDLFVGDVGESNSEEVNFVPKEMQAGANYGWPRYEGTMDFFVDREVGEEQVITPIFTYRHTGTQCAVIGGRVYRGSVASLHGVYLFGDFCEGTIRGMRVTDGAAEMVALPDLGVPNLVSFGEDSDGEMYVVSLAGGVFRLNANSS